MAFLGVEGTSGSFYYPDLSSGPGNLGFTHNSWSNVSTTYYKWDVPSAGTYELHANLRSRLWGTTGFMKYRIYRNSDGDTNDIHLRMGYEFQNSVYSNVQQHFTWVVSTTSGSEVWYLQGLKTTNSSGLSLQSDSNGWNSCWWRKIG